MVGKRTVVAVRVCVWQQLEGCGAGWVGGGLVRLSFKDPACSPIFHTTVTS